MDNQHHKEFLVKREKIALDILKSYIRLTSEGASGMDGLERLMNLDPTGTTVIMAIEKAITFADTFLHTIDTHNKLDYVENLK